MADHAEQQDGLGDGEGAPGNKGFTNALMQQKLKAWQPILSPKWVISSFGVFGAVFVAIGVVLIAESQRVVEIETDTYLDGTGFVKALTVDVTADMDAPVYMYYELTNFYQNHRRYIKSRDDAQLLGETLPRLKSDISNCDPLQTSTTKISDSASKDRLLYPCGLVARSCFNDTYQVSVRRAGNDDTYTAITLDMAPKTVAWESDVDHKFRNVNPAAVGAFEGFDGDVKNVVGMDMWILNYFPPYICVPSDNAQLLTDRIDVKQVTDPTHQVAYPDCDWDKFNDGEGNCAECKCRFTKTANPTAQTPSAPVDYPCTETPNADGYVMKRNPAGWGVGNGHFIVWMRTAGLPTFRKLYAKIDTDLKAGDTILVNAVNVFPVSDFEGTKRVVFSTATWVGGKNNFLGVGYSVVGGICIVFAVFFAIKHYTNPRALGDIDYLDWIDR